MFGQPKSMFISNLETHSFFFLPVLSFIYESPLCSEKTSLSRRHTKFHVNRGCKLEGENKYLNNASLSENIQIEKHVCTCTYKINLK